MSIIDKFRQISKDIKENMLLNSMKFNDNDLEVHKEDKIIRRFYFYKQKKDFVEMDKSIDMLQSNVRYPRYLENYQRDVVFLAAKENKQVAYDYMTKYKLEFNRFTLFNIMNDNNLPVLELYMINPAVKFNGNYKDLISPEIIAEHACEKGKMDFLHFACNFPNQDSKFYASAITNALRTDFPEGTKFVATHYKEKFSSEDFIELTKTAIKYGRLPMAEYLKEMSNDNNISLPNGPIEQKIKQLREENFGKDNTNNILKK